MTLSWTWQRFEDLGVDGVYDMLALRARVFILEQGAYLDPDVIDHVIRVDDEPAYATTKRLFREEGLIVGPSTGAIAHAAAEFLRENPGTAVGISPDSGFKYASYFTDILGDEGLPTG